ncbi:branched-chain amino acid ABC transporter permease [Formosimonas limnophila]|uniref:Branched-chain amino acid ABC transporter permease n=1 Tax=Formosimonas limnophila TaxID=1384487 RepID=A0A8J3G0F1_9BURK|nr:branched-chain amino acid ABC transporter permease [Formosimonas limnophila]GHA69196.1 branched-chain amino acid ABC transporter permease [Formosimonas limnophila]
MELEKFFQLLIGGVVVGSIYAMIALGYTMVYGILGIINFAHAEVMMIGAMVAMTVSSILIAAGLPLLVVLLLAALVAMMACMILSYCMERFAYRPLRNAPKLTPLITAIGLSFLIQAVAQLIWGKSPRPFPELLPSTRVILFGDVGITVREIVIVGLSIVMMMGLLTLVERTKLGRAMRATSENVGVTGLMGVNPNRVISATFMIGAALAAVAGIMYAMNSGGKAHFYMGFMPGMKAFVAAVLGGIGNIPGAVVGGIVLGLAEAFGAGYISSEYQDVFAFVVLVVVLIFRPSGLLGQRTADRA